MQSSCNVVHSQLGAGLLPRNVQLPPRCADDVRRGILLLALGPGAHRAGGYGYGARGGRSSKVSHTGYIHSQMIICRGEGSCVDRCWEVQCPYVCESRMASSCSPFVVEKEECVLTSVGAMDMPGSKREHSNSLRCHQCLGQASGHRQSLKPPSRKPIFGTLSSQLSSASPSGFEKGP